METLNWADFPRDVQVEVLKELGFTVDEEFVLDASGARVLDRYVKVPIRINNLLIVPGSTLLLDNNPVSIASYFEEYGEVL